LAIGPTDVALPDEVGTTYRVSVFRPVLPLRYTSPVAPS